MRKPAYLVVLLILALGAAVERAGARAQPAGNAPARLQFRAVAEDGQPVTDLKPADVSLRVNGKAREIRSLDIVQLTATGAPAAAAVSPPFVSNVSSEPGRDVLIVYDDVSLAPGKEQSLRDGVTQVLNGLTPGDRAGLLSVRGGGTNIALTNQFATIKAALAPIHGGAPNIESMDNFVCRSRTAIDTLMSLVKAPTERAQTIVFFTASLGVMPAALRTGQMGQASGLCQILPAIFQDFGTAARASDTAFYAVQVVEGIGLISDTPERGDPRAAPTSGKPISAQTAVEGLENLAGATGTELVRLSGNSSPGLARILRETSAYYTVTFDVEPGERTGASHRLDLKVARDRVKVLARPEISFGGTAAKADGKAAPEANPKDMLRVPTVYRDLPIRALGLSARNPGNDEVRVVALFEAVDPATRLTAASVGLFDEKGTLKKQWSAQDADLAKSPVMAVLTAAPGKYRMRVATADASGRGGTADYELVAALTAADPLKLSALTLGSNAGGAMAPKLMFTAEDPAAIGYLEIYNVPKNGNLSVKFELAATEEGEPLGSGEAMVRPASTEDSRQAYGGFPLNTLAPGDYVMRAIVMLDGKPVGKVTRTLRKVKG